MKEGIDMLLFRVRPTILGCLLVLLAWSQAHADGLSAIKACEADNELPEDAAKLTILPNGETRGSDTAAKLVKMARQKAKEGKDDEAIQWAALCHFSEASEQEAIKKDRTSVLQYLKQ
jgi:hypothetical protein